MNVPRKYGLLRAIAFILKLLAWVVLAAALIGTIVLLTNLGGSTATDNQFLRALGSAGVVATPLLGVIWFIQLFAFGSILSLLVDVEENTRALAAEARE